MSNSELTKNINDILQEIIQSNINDILEEIKKFNIKEKNVSNLSRKLYSITKKLYLITKDIIKTLPPFDNLKLNKSINKILKQLNLQDKKFENELKFFVSKSFYNNVKITGGMQRGDDEDEDEDENFCPICLQKFEPEELEVYTNWVSQGEPAGYNGNIVHCSNLFKRHKYHRGCIRKWLLDNNITCPMCTEAFISDNNNSFDEETIKNILEAQAGREEELRMLGEDIQIIGNDEDIQFIEDEEDIQRREIEEIRRRHEREMVDFTVNLRNSLFRTIIILSTAHVIVDYFIDRYPIENSIRAEIMGSGVFLLALLVNKYIIKDLGFTTLLIIFYSITAYSYAYGIIEDISLHQLTNEERLRYNFYINQRNNERNQAIVQIIEDTAENLPLPIQDIHNEFMNFLRNISQVPHNEMGGGKKKIKSKKSKKSKKLKKSKKSKNSKKSKRKTKRT
tara:strand:+ start:119 stop:1471 length:1353 start_codon:yes stop_codon:yes gene_type:complete